MFVHEFKNWLREEKRYPENTVKAYLRDVEQFLQFMETTYASNYVDTFTRKQIQSWLASLMNQDIERTSINRKLSSVKAYFRFLKRSKKLQQNPSEGIQAPKPPKRLVKDVAEQDLIRALDQHSWGEDEKSQQDRLIMEVLYGTGVRLSELIDLKIGDIQNDSIHVRGKGDKERNIPIYPDLQHQLRAFVKIRQANDQVSANSHVFLTAKGRKLYPMYVHRVVNEVLSSINRDYSVSPHKLRHAFATHLLNKGADLNAIKELLGHQGLAATEVYTHNSVERLKTVFNKAHPKAKKP